MATSLITVPSESATPSVLAQTEWPTGLYAFPESTVPVRWFNPSIAMWRNIPRLITRQCKYAITPATHDRNNLTVWELNATLTHVRNEHLITFPNAHPTDQWEDPRATVTPDGILHVGYATHRSPWPRPVSHQALATIDAGCNVTSTLHVEYGNNRTPPIANIGHEKNWLWFWRDDVREQAIASWHIIYRTSPHAVLRINDTGTSTIPRITAQWHEPSFTWPYGIPRGGTPPILHDNLYWSFFHSSLDLHPKRAPRRCYYMGAYAFDSYPPFTPRYYTREPLLTGSTFDARQPQAPLCVFPCGALLNHDVWHVTFGVNDESCGWIKITHSDLTDRLTKIS